MLAATSTLAVGGSPVSILTRRDTDDIPKLARRSVLSIRDQCERAQIPFFFKQWGGVRKSKAGRELDGKTYDGVPRREQMPVLEQPMRLAAIAEFERLYQRAETAAEPSLLPAQGATST